MRIFVAGTRGIPGIPGGVETHCNHLYPLIAEKGYQVKCSRRKPYVDDDLSSWNGVELVNLYSPRFESTEAIVHTFLAVIEAKRWRADILHIHAIGPAIMVPFARLLGLNVVFTNHGPDYDREKWGRFAKSILRAGEWLGGKFADEIIVISDVIREIVSERCGRESNLVYNGVKIPEKCDDTAYIQSLGLDSKNYILAVARFVPEKGLGDLVNAFERSNLDCKLVIAGDGDHDDDYSKGLKQLASKNSRIVLTGYIGGRDLNSIYSHAKLFVLPSYHEGLPIALLEALSYGIIPLVSNIPANLEVPLDQKFYFQCKEVDDLKRKLEELFNIVDPASYSSGLVNLVQLNYNWEEISTKTIDVYKRVLNIEKE
jgi:glycosyltransferase involved in cell wall biosynthesis